MSVITNPIGRLIRSSLENRTTSQIAVFAQSGTIIGRDALLGAIDQLLAGPLHPDATPTRRLLLYLPKSPLYIEWLLASFEAGNCVCPVDPSVGEVELQRVVDSFRPERIVSLRRLTLHGYRQEPSTNGSFMMVEEAARSRSSLPAGSALCMFTSGTTGQPKGVLLTDTNLAEAATLPVKALQLQSEDRVMAILPITMMNGLVTTLLGTLYARSSAVFYEGMFTPYLAMQWCIQYQATWLNAVPVHYAAFCNPFLTNDERQGHLIRMARSAGAPLPHAVQDRFESHYQFPIIETMGLTETAGQVFANPPSVALRKPGTVGQPFGVEARVVDSSGQSLDNGQEGEIWIRGPVVFPGYLDDPVATRQALHENWLRTGDLGVQDGDGFFRITGRIKEIVIRGGQNVSLREIDETLMRHPSVALCGSVGCPHPSEGEVIVSFVVLKEDAPTSTADMLKHMRAQLAPFKIPYRFEFRDQLPTLINGKLDKSSLKSEAGRLLALNLS